jgi:6-phosphogluconolactonase
MTPQIVVAKIAELAEEFAALLAHEAAAAISARGAFTLAVPGGSASQEFLPRLASAPIEWKNVDVFQVDERAVDPHDPDANFPLLEVLPGRLHRMPGEARDLDAAALAYATALPSRLDVVLLGVGPDGHVASLFPGHTALSEAERPVVAIYDSPKPPPRRLTLTLPVLTRARLVVIAAFGAAKAEVMRECLGDPDSALPVSLVFRNAARVVVMLDGQAAARPPAR